MITCNPALLVVDIMASRDLSAPAVFLWPLPDTRFPSALHRNDLLIPKSPMNSVPYAWRQALDFQPPLTIFTCQRTENAIQLLQELIAADYGLHRWESLLPSVAAPRSVITFAACIGQDSVNLLRRSSTRPIVLSLSYSLQKVFAKFYFGKNPSNSSSKQLSYLVFFLPATRIQLAGRQSSLSLSFGFLLFLRRSIALLYGSELLKANFTTDHSIKHRTVFQLFYVPICRHFGPTV